MTSILARLMPETLSLAQYGSYDSGAFSRVRAAQIARARGNAPGGNAPPAVQPAPRPLALNPGALNDQWIHSTYGGSA
jgi:hypothetical protein